jgi:hypothetical protein
MDIACNSNNLYVLDTTNIYVLPTGGITANNPTATITLAHGQSSNALSLAVDSTHLLLGTSNGLIKSYTLSGFSSLSTPAATLTLSTTNKVNGLFSDGTTIWIASSDANRVITYAGYTTATITVGTNSGYTMGQSTTTGTGTGSTPSTMNGL